MIYPIHPIYSQMKTRLLLIVAATATLLLGGCRASRQTPQPSTQPAVTDASRLYKTLVDNAASWDDVTVPVRLELKSPASVSVSGRARMVRGQSVNISLRVLGMEVAQLHVTRDSLFAAYRLKKQYVAESLTAALGKFPVTIDNLQDLLLGRPFVLGTPTLGDAGRKAVEISREGPVWNVIPAGAPSGMSYGFRTSEVGLVERFVAYALDRSLVAAVGYGGDLATPAGPIAREVDIEVTKGKRKVVASIEWKLDDAKWNTGANPQWSAPRGYTRLRGHNLLKMVSGL